MAEWTEDVEAVREEFERELADVVRGLEDELRILRDDIDEIRSAL